jgi:glycine/D-amino acid oxidase-like deaminating enzyme
LACVQVSPDRVIRTTSGCVPSVLRASRAHRKFGEKTVVHNYGHGGSAITLSWGTGQLAVDQANDVETGPARECAVIGCGVIGLSTARLLQLRSYRPTIRVRWLSAKLVPTE